MAMGDPGRLQAPELAGWLARRRTAAGAAVVVDVAAPPWTLSGVKIAMANFEVSRAGAFEALPTALTQPLNAYGRFIALSCEDSPVGAFSWACLILAGRLRVAPRDWVVDWIGDGAGLLAGAGELALPIRPGRIAFAANGHKVAIQVADDRDTAMATFNLSREVTLDPTQARYDNLVYPRARDATLELVQVRVVPEADEAWTDRHFDLRLAPDGFRDTYRPIEPVFAITATYAECDSATLTAPDVVGRL